jgi:GNAT superfamily N-acetyltransferase
MALDSEIVKGYVPGSLGRIAELHATYYERHAGFGLYFESKVACELAAFLQRYDERRDAFWLARCAGRVEGSIVIDGIDAGSEGAHLRWFIVSDAMRGRGAGNRLMAAALNFCRERKFGRVYLWTFEGLGAARYLYEKNGFRLTQQRRGTQWGKEVSEQRFELQLA